MTTTKTTAPDEPRTLMERVALLERNNMRLAMCVAEAHDLIASLTFNQGLLMILIKQQEALPGEVAEPCPITKAH